MVKLLMRIAVAEVLRCNRLVMRERCLVVVIFRQGLIANCRCLEKWFLVPVGRTDSLSVFTMWHLVVFLDHGVCPCLVNSVEH